MGEITKDYLNYRDPGYSYSPAKLSAMMGYGNSSEQGGTSNYLGIPSERLPYGADSGGVLGGGIGRGSSDFLSQLNTLGAPNGATPGFMDSLGGFFKSAIGTRDNPGWGGLALGTAQGIGSLYLGMKQYGLAKDSLETNKRQFQMQYDAQKNLTNSRLEDRQSARVQSDPGAHVPVDEYMKKYGVK